MELMICLMLVALSVLVTAHLPAAALRRLRGWSEPVVDAWSVEQHARYVVQKIARAAAAGHALSVAENRPVKVRESNGVVYLDENLHYAWRDIEALRRRRDDAERIRSYAVADLRRVLGLPEHPTHAECGIWGEAP